MSRRSSHQAAAPSNDRPQSWIAPKNTGDRTSSPICQAVLVVEDEADIRDIIVDFLRAHDFEVHEAENGREALHALQLIPRAVLILADLMMPVMDGSALIEALRTHDRSAALRVVIVSAADRGVPEGYRRLKKPIDLDELLRIVEELCLRRRVAAHQGEADGPT
jgi:CheY-like chemotaxis protein